MNGSDPLTVDTSNLLPAGTITTFLTNNTGTYPLDGYFLLNNPDSNNADDTVRVKANATAEELRAALIQFNSSAFNWTTSDPPTGVEMGVQTADIITKEVAFTFVHNGVQ